MERVWLQDRCTCDLGFKFSLGKDLWELQGLHTCTIVCKRSTLHCIFFFLEILCDEPDEVEHANWNVSSYKPGAVASYTCDVGFQLKTTDSRKCLDTGDWSDQRIRCTSESHRAFCVIVTD